MIRPGPARARFYSILIILPLLAAGAIGFWQIFRPRYTFPRSEGDYYTVNPILGHSHRPNAVREVPWPEHPLGIRSDRDHKVEKAAGSLRILVVGDSHMDGVVYNSESFATIIEALLNQNSQISRFESLNVAAGYYGPDEYLACATAYDYLAPDHFLVGLYSGNDFLDAAKRVETFIADGMTRPSGYKSRLRRAQHIHDGAVAQILNQAFYFKTFPHMKIRVLDNVEAIFRELHRKTALKKMTLTVMLIPTKWDVEQSAIGGKFFEAAGALGLSREDLDLAAKLSSELAGRLVWAGIRTWTLPVAAHRPYSPIFWQRDYHLNVTGHGLLARLIAPSLITQLTRD
jgi:hypothetical protein